MPHVVSSECVYISEVPKFLANSPSVTIHALQLTDPFI